MKEKKDYYDGMKELWENSYPSIFDLSEVESFYKESGYNKSLQAILDGFMRRIDHSGNPRILDYGCDNGIMLNYFKKYSSALYGLDINRKAIEDGKRLFPEFDLGVSDGTTLPYEDKFFDVIFLSAVLKHIRHEDRRAFYREMKRAGKHFIIIEKNSEKEQVEEFEGFTFYHSNFVKELSEYFHPIDVFTMGGDCCGLYAK